MKKIVLASDHAGYALKNKFINNILSHNFFNHKKLLDCGSFSEEPCDYPDALYPALLALRDDVADYVFAFCHSGNGVNIFANKFYDKIRSCVIYSEHAMEMAIKHNNANCFCFVSSIILDPAPFLDILSRCGFENGRHDRRLQKIYKYKELHEKD